MGGDKSMKLGIIYCCYGNSEYLSFSEPWFLLKKEYDFSIAAVSGIFREYAELGISEDNTKTSEFLLKNKDNNNIDFLWQQPSDWEIDSFLTEAQIRDIGLQYLLSQNVTHVMLLDADERYEGQEIVNLINYLKKDEFSTVFRIEFKNLIFDKGTYAKGFEPFRIWRVNTEETGSYKLNKVIYDNDCEYIEKNTNYLKKDKDFSIKKIPPALVNPLHYTWCDIERAKRKVAYQEKHFSTGCSFKIENNKLNFNIKYFIKTNSLPPDIYRLNSLLD